MRPQLDFLVKDKPWKHTMRALNASKNSKRDGWTYAWFMARASYEYSRSRGLTRRESFAGAWELFWEKL